METTMSTTTQQRTTAEAVKTSRWRIDPARSSVEFGVPTFWGRATVTGHFGRYNGTLDLERTPAIELTIDADSLDTNNKLRDKHLRSRDFFDTENHPQVRFVSDSATLDGEHLKVRGRLYASGKSVPLEIDARLRRAGDELQLEVRTNADHRELGMTHSTLGMIRTPSELTVRGRLVRDAG
jgi:polyisoprenoid-binding protein YceI